MAEFQDHNVKRSSKEAWRLKGANNNEIMEFSGKTKLEYNKRRNMLTVGSIKIKSMISTDTYKTSQSRNNICEA